MTEKTEVKRIDVKTIINENDIPSCMMTYWQLVGVLTNLQDVLERNISGAIVELGCNVGTTSIYIRKLLDIYKSDKEYHVYDSWEGLPPPHKKDINTVGRNFSEGSCKTSIEQFKYNMQVRGLKCPTIHSGWFKEIPDEEYPEQICFAFFDGDFYTSIIDSFNKTYNKVLPGGIILVDDCGWSVLPGCELACLEFLEDKKEYLTLDGYPNDKGIFGDKHCGGKVIKK